MIVRTDAVVLRHMAYGETSQIVTLFTRDQGKVAGLAKGARKMPNRFGSALEPMAYVQVVYYHKESRGLQTLTQSSHVRPWLGLSRNLEKLAIGQRMMEILNGLLEDGEPNPSLFNLTVNVLSALDSAEHHIRNLLPYFELQLAIRSGFTPRLDGDAIRAVPEEGGVLDVERGAIRTDALDSGSIRPASRGALRAFALFCRLDLDTLLRMELTDTQRQEVEHLVEAYMQHHFDTTYPTRSTRIIGQILEAARDA
ncbi:MAG: DNA repair protein RecO [Rhodothermales bacterium]